MDHATHDHSQMGHAAHDHGHMGHDHGHGHAHMVEDFKRRFWISLILTLPVLILSPMVQQALGLGDAFRFAGDS